MPSFVCSKSFCAVASLPKFKKNKMILIYFQIFIFNWKLKFLVCYLIKIFIYFWLLTFVLDWQVWFWLQWLIIYSDNLFMLNQKVDCFFNLNAYDSQKTKYLMTHHQKSLKLSFIKKLFSSVSFILRISEFKVVHLI